MLRFLGFAQCLCFCLLLVHPCLLPDSKSFGSNWGEIGTQFVPLKRNEHFGSSSDTKFHLCLQELLERYHVGFCSLLCSLSLRLQDEAGG